MRLNKDFLIHITEKETVLVPTGKAGFSGVVRGNKTLGAVLELLKNEMSEDEIITALKQRFDAPDGAIEKDIKKVLSELSGIGALEGEIK